MIYDRRPQSEESIRKFEALISRQRVAVFVAWYTKRRGQA